MDKIENLLPKHLAQFFQQATHETFEMKLPAGEEQQREAKDREVPMSSPGIGSQNIFVTQTHTPPPETDTPDQWSGRDFPSRD